MALVAKALGRSASAVASPARLQRRCKPHAGRPGLETGAFAWAALRAWGPETWGITFFNPNRNKYGLCSRMCYLPLCCLARQVFGQSLSQIMVPQPTPKHAQCFFWVAVCVLRIRLRLRKRGWIAMQATKAWSIHAVEALSDPMLAPSDADTNVWNGQMIYLDTLCDKLSGQFGHLFEDREIPSGNGTPYSRDAVVERLPISRNWLGAGSKRSRFPN